MTDDVRSLGDRLAALEKKVDSTLAALDAVLRELKALTENTARSNNAAMRLGLEVDGLGQKLDRLERPSQAKPSNR
jgi:hypothetical protein